MERNRNKYIITILLIMIVLILIKFIYIKQLKVKKDFTQIKSGNLSTDYQISQVLEDIEIMQLNTINLPIVIEIENLSSSEIAVNEYSKEKGIKLIEILEDRDIQIILEPYPWIANGSEYETEWNPSDIDQFFWNWKNEVLKTLIEEIAVPYNIEILNIGTGFDHMEYAHGYWLDLIEYVRGIYDGKITYRTSWWVTAVWDETSFERYEEKLNNPIFGELDFISIAAYFELTDRETNSVENLVKALHSTQIFDREQNVKEEIRGFYEKWNKKIFFGELGFPRTTKASIHPWDPYGSDIINNSEQANCFKAYRRVFEGEDWFLGFSIFAIGEKGEDKLYYPSEESIGAVNSL